MFGKLSFVGVVLAVAGIAATSVPAQAAVPVDGGTLRPFAVECSTGQRALVSLPAAGTYAPGFVVDTDAIVVPYRFDYRLTDGHGTVLVRSEAQAESGPVPRDAITCTLAPVEYADGTFFSFTMSAVVRAAS